jgi:NAD(P)-dependent dehydrogenase (short-subunit alcohol dehydrogenase family)
LGDAALSQVFLGGFLSEVLSEAFYGRTTMATVLITGGNSGIGKATALLFAQRGYKVAIAARKPGSLAMAQQEIEPHAPVMAIPMDVTDPTAVNQMVEQVTSQWGEIDVLVHAAGVLFSGTILDTDEQTWDQLIDINLKGTYLVNRAVLRQMVERGSGSIVNIASDAGITGGRNIAAYCASKGGVVLLTKALALDHARQGVRINALCPGPVATPMTDDLDPTERSLWESVLPIQRFATVTEIAEAAYFLAHAEYATGSCLSIDGGNTAGGSL